MTWQNFGRSFWQHQIYCLLQMLECSGSLTFTSLSKNLSMTLSGDPVYIIVTRWRYKQYHLTSLCDVNSPWICSRKIRWRFSSILFLPVLFDDRWRHPSSRVQRSQLFRPYNVIHARNVVILSDVIVSFFVCYVIVRHIRPGWPVFVSCFLVA